jgi:hypothetical protein
VAHRRQADVEPAGDLFQAQALSGGQREPAATDEISSGAEVSAAIVDL